MTWLAEAESGDPGAPQTAYLTYWAGIRRTPSGGLEMQLRMSAGAHLGHRRDEMESAYRRYRAESLQALLRLVLEELGQDAELRDRDQAALRALARDVTYQAEDAEDA